MSEARLTDTAANSPKGRPTGRKTEKRGFFARIILFVRQTIAELKKVVTPTRRELVNYTLVVIAFVAIMMLLVTVLDLVFGQAAFFVFGDGIPEQ
jgi:preprotein translocase subunit SecE